MTTMEKIMLVVSLEKTYSDSARQASIEARRAKMESTHSVTSPETYDLKAFGTKVGTVKRTEGGFYAETIFGDGHEAKTMAGVKDWMNSQQAQFQGTQDRFENKAQGGMTTDEARKFSGMSHTQANRMQGMIKRFWPEVKQGQLGMTMVALAFKEKAKFERGEFERNWLKENEKHLPKLQKVDWDHFNEFNRVKYLPGTEGWL